MQQQQQQQLQHKLPARLRLCGGYSDFRLWRLAKESGIFPRNELDTSLWFVHDEDRKTSVEERERDERSGDPPFLATNSFSRMVKFDMSAHIVVNVPPEMDL